MGNRAAACCGEGLPSNTDLPMLRVTNGLLTRPALRPGARSEMERLLAGCPRELADTLRQTGHWSALRCRPWLSPNALRGLHRSLQQCQLLKLVERHREAATPEECTYDCPPTIKWSDLDLDHIVSAGQVFKREAASLSQLDNFRRVGLQALRQGKVGLVLLAGGASLRLLGAEPPAGCSGEALGLVSGKSILQLCCERLRRIVMLCRSAAEDSGKAAPSHPSIPVFVMTSKLTHRTIIEHFEAHRNYGLLSRDLFFFQQPLMPVVHIDGHLLPQSLGGEFAQAPGGTGQVFSAMVSSSALEQMRDRGVDSVHVVGIDNAMTRVCDPVYIGFCREVDVDCACKTVARVRPDDDLELFCLRQNAVKTHYADVEEMACGLNPADAPKALLAQKSSEGASSVGGSINSFYISVPYIEEAVARPVCMRRVARAVPYLDFHVAANARVSAYAAANWDNDPSPRQPLEGSAVLDGSRQASPDNLDSELRSGLMPAPGVVQPGSWPSERGATDLTSQRALRAAAAQVLTLHGLDLPVDPDEVWRRVDSPEESLRRAAWRCEAHMDVVRPAVTVYAQKAERGPAILDHSFFNPNYETRLPVGDEIMLPPLRCSLVVPTYPNAHALETSVLDYFMFTDRAVAFEVERRSEFAPVRELRGLYSAENARTALSDLHRRWIFAAGGVEGRSGGLVEVSPLLSYEGEGLDSFMANHRSTVLPAHLPGAQEEPTDEDGWSGRPDETVMDDGLDTRFFYFQEYKQRLEVSTSHRPQFRQLQAQLPPASTPASFSQADGGIKPSVRSR